MFRTILMLIVEFFLLLFSGCAGDGGAADGIVFRGRDISEGEVYFGYSSEDRQLIEDEELRSGVLKLILEADSRRCNPDWKAGSYIHCDYGEIIIDGESIEIGVLLCESFDGSVDDFGMPLVDLYEAACYINCSDDNRTYHDIECMQEIERLIYQR